MPKQKALEAEVAELKQQLAELRGQTGDVAESLTDRVNGYVERAVANGSAEARHAVATGTARARDAVEHGRAAAISLAEDTAVRAMEAEETVADAIRDRPLMSVGLAFAAGLILCKATAVAGRRS